MRKVQLIFVIHPKRKKEFSKQEIVNCTAEQRELADKYVEQFAATLFGDLEEAF
jgi:hypothetical protein